MRAQPVAASTELVLFDLDGTLADTAPDLAAAINACLRARELPQQAMAQLRPWASHGARGLIKQAFGLVPGDSAYEPLRREFLERYAARLCVETQLFPGVTQMLAALEAAGRRWGIVTNKVERLTTPLVRQLQLDRRAACVVSGDTAPRPKPDPAPILHALAHCGSAPAAAIYVGDDRRDISAGRSAGVGTVAVAYGYSAQHDAIADWGADLIIDHPWQLPAWLLQADAPGAPALTPAHSAVARHTPAACPHGAPGDAFGRYAAPAAPSASGKSDRAPG